MTFDDLQQPLIFDLWVNVGQITYKKAGNVFPNPKFLETISYTYLVNKYCFSSI